MRGKGMSLREAAKAENLSPAGILKPGPSRLVLPTHRMTIESSRSACLAAKGMPTLGEIAYRLSDNFRGLVDSIRGGEGTINYLSWVDNLEVQVNGRWIDAYSFTSEKGQIGSHEVIVSESSANGTDKAWMVFADGKWRSTDNIFSKAGQCNALAKNGEYIGLDFGAKPLAITGYRVFGNGALDPITGAYSDEMFAQNPDNMHWERSADGKVWETISKSRSTSLAAEVIELEW